ncbi:MAG: hypothetical protein LWW81_13235 [Rhodocyclales bacterium]|nr:hypothetical protein [Rhodocyclales bacterium]
MNSRISNFFYSLDLLDSLLSLVLSIGMLTYVGMTWILHFLDLGMNLAALALAALLLGTFALALLRFISAQIIILGTAVICGCTISLGFSQYLFP